MNRKIVLLAAALLLIIMGGAAAIMSYIYRPQLEISEVCPSNDGLYDRALLKDSKGELCDWIEIYDPADRDTTLEGWSVRKNGGEEYPLGSSAVKGGSYFIIYCSKSGFDSDEPHADFNIPKNESCVIELLYKGKVRDKLTLEPVEKGRSLVRDGEGALYVTDPTPCAENSTAVTGSTPKLGKNGGYYSQGFELDIKAGKGQKIYYTTDGTDPRTSATRTEYTSPVEITDRRTEPNGISGYDPSKIQLNFRPGHYSAPKDEDVDKVTVIKAVAEGDEGLYGRVETATYLVGLTPESHSSMPFISMTIDPDDLYNQQTGIYCLGDIYSQYAADHPDHKFNGSVPANYTQRGREWERECHIEFYESDGTLRLSQNAGVRIQGGWSRAEYQKSLRFFARGSYGESAFEYPFWENVDENSFDTFVLRNGGNDTNYSKFKDTMIQELASGRSFATQSGRPCVLYINGEYWGFYTLQEDYSQEYFANHYDVKKSSVAIYKNDELDEGDEEDPESFDKLYELVTTYDLTDEQNYKNVCELLDVENFADYAAAEWYIFNDDWPQNNYGCWRADEGKGEYADGRWRFFMFDTESCAYHYSTKNQGRDMLEYIESKHSSGIARFLLSLLENEEFSRMFYARLAEMKECFSYERVSDFTERYKAEYLPEMEAYFKRFPTDHSYNESTLPMLTRMDMFFKERQVQQFGEK